MLASSVAVCEESLQSFSQCRDVIMQREKQLWKKEGETVGRIVFSFRRFHCASQRTPTHLLSEIRSLLWTNSSGRCMGVICSMEDDQCGLRKRRLSVCGKPVKKRILL